MRIGTPDDAVPNSECSQRPRENEFRIQDKTLQSEADEVTSRDIKSPVIELGGEIS